MTAPEHLFQLGDGEFPPLKTLDATNLPVAAGPLLGREKELAELIPLLQNGARLLTITGPGGTGKTRLALQVAAELTGAFTDGVFWVPLAGLDDPELVLPAIEQTTGASGDLTEHVRGKQLLLLLDNAEHLLAAAPALAELIAASPRLRLLVTSRAPLRVSAEQEFPLEPLSTMDAVTLFVERARALGRVVGSDATTRAICRRLDGLPLAVELAAARVRLLDPKTLLERLERALPLLTDGARDAPERQRTLRATIEWSYDLLGEDARRLFAALSVFSGSFSLEAAEEVCEAELDTLAALVDMSLLKAIGESRFLMLETIREYAIECAAPDRDKTTGARHAAFFLALANEAKPNLRGLAAADWLDRLERDHDNIRSAFDYYATTDPALALTLANAVVRLWWLRGYLAEGRWRLESALAATPSAPTRSRGYAYHALEWLVSSQGDLYQGRTFAERALEIYRELGDAAGMAGTLNTLGANAARRGDVDAAQALYDEARQIYLELGDEHGLSMTLGNLGELALDRGEFSRAEGLIREAIVRERELGWHEGVLLGHLALGRLYLELSDARGAEVQFQESLQLAQELGHKEGIAESFDRLAAAAVACAEFERAGRLLGAASAFRADLGIVADALYAAGVARTSAAAREHLGAAEYERRLTDGAAMPLEQALEYAARQSSSTCST
jgi:predicted ATPase